VKSVSNNIWKHLQSTAAIDNILKVNKVSCFSDVIRIQRDRSFNAMMTGSANKMIHLFFYVKLK